MPLVDQDEPVFHKLAEGAAHGLELHAQVAADFLALHAQDHLGAGEAPGMQALREVEQEGGQPFFGAHAAQEQHDTVLANNLSAHDLVHVVLQGIDFAGEFFHAFKGHDAHLGVFKGNGVAAMNLVDDAIEPHDFAGHLKTGDLIEAAIGHHAGLEKAGANGVERREGVPCGKERLTALDLAAGLDELVDLGDIILGEVNRHAQLAQVAIGAGDLDGLNLHGVWGEGVHPVKANSVTFYKAIVRFSCSH